MIVAGRMASQICGASSLSGLPSGRLRVGYCRVFSSPPSSFRSREIVALCAALAVAGCATRPGGTSSGAAEAYATTRASLLPDVSGLAWLGGDRFLAVHDAKFPDEPDLPRVSLLDLPVGLDGILWTSLAVQFPGQPASDLESVARLPGTDGRPRVLVAESTEVVAEKPFSRRIFLLEVTAESAVVLDHADWPIPTRNVEGVSVFEAGGRLVFLFAERAHGERSSEIRWAEMTLEPLAFGPFRSAGPFASPGPTGPIARPVSALEVDADGVIYAASAADPDDDSGPFRSAVYRIGRVVATAGRPAVELDAQPTLLGRLDGLKVESLAAREMPGEPLELWVGVDDENYGGTIRPLPIP
jgi:hypothetical protein